MNKKTFTLVYAVFDLKNNHKVFFFCFFFVKMTRINGSICWIYEAFSCNRVDGMTKKMRKQMCYSHSLIKSPMMWKTRFIEMILFLSSLSIGIKKASASLCSVMCP